MSNLVIPNEAILNWAQALILDIPTASDCYLRLFKAAIDIDAATTLAELEAAQADYDGYAPIQLANWSDAVIVDSAAMTEADVVSYEAAADAEGSIYGCYATNGAGDKLWFASLFSEAVPIPFLAELQVSIELDLASIFTT